MMLRESTVSDRPVPSDAVVAAISGADWPAPSRPVPALSFVSVLAVACCCLQCCHAILIQIYSLDHLKPSPRWLAVAYILVIKESNAIKSEDGCRQSYRKASNKYPLSAAKFEPSRGTLHNAPAPTTMLLWCYARVESSIFLFWKDGQHYFGKKKVMSIWEKSY